MHGVGRNRRVLPDGGRRPEVVQPEQAAGAAAHVAGELSFVQISDSHMGFNKPANPDVVAHVEGGGRQDQRARRRRPNSCCTPATSATCRNRRSSTRVDQMLKSASAKDVFFVPGEHDVLEDDGKQYLRALRQRIEGRRLVQLRQEGRALHRPGERDEPEGRRPRHARRRAARVAEGRRQASEAQHADRRLRAHSAVDRVPAVGLGHGRQRAGARAPEEVRLGHGAERAHPPDHAEGRRAT